mmetsp:Transcript_103150/g.332322  ORF Transcript_103150/g.332322 Transcript_103150/m.332322 type:complete len:249 (-) Transcript_103150:443-1189(-)
MRTAPFTAAAAGHVSSDETKLCKMSLLCGVFQPPWEVRHSALPHRHQSSLVDQLQTKAEILATHLQVLAPIHVQGDLVHRPLGEVALEWPLPDGPHKQAKLDPNPLSASIQLQPQCTIERRARLTFPGLRSKAHVAALTGSPSLARQEVHAEVVATSDLQRRKDHGAPATAPQFLEHALDTPLGARLLVISLASQVCRSRPHQHRPTAEAGAEGPAGAEMRGGRCRVAPKESTVPRRCQVVPRASLEP